MRLPHLYKGILNARKRPLRYLKGLCGAEEGLNEPIILLLMLVKAVNEENVLVKEELDVAQF